MRLTSTTSIAALLTGAVLLTSCASPSGESAPGDTGGEEVVVTGTDTGETPSEPAPPPPPPPPPPPSPAPVASSEASGFSKARGEGREASDVAAPSRPAPDSMPEPMPLPPQPPAQSGLLTAGDYDDLLNAKLYRDYASEFLQNAARTLDLPDIDVTDAITLKVTDRNGKPVRGATVALSTGDTEMFALKTSSAGTVRLFPQFDALPKDLDVVITGRGAAATRMNFADISQNDISEPITVQIQEVALAPSQIDLMLVIDTTGSMADELRYLQAELTDIVDGIEQAHPGIDTRVGLTVYRDIGDQYVVREFDFTSNIEELQGHLNAQSAGGGGNYPEAMDQALEAALGQSWRPESVKVAMLVADAPPRDENLSKAWDQAILARTQQIHIVPVAASGVGPKAEYMMRAMAAATQSRYIFLTDDSGVGNPHAEPDVDCYVVTRLDTMVKRVISGLIDGERVEPSDEEIIRTVGSYNAGVCEATEEGQDRVVLTGGE